MSRTQKLPSGSEAVSNVIPLRPGIALPTSKPKAKTRQKSLQRMTTRTSDLRSETTATRSKKSSPDNVLTMTPASPQISETATLSSPILNERQRKDAAFKKRVASLGKTALREHFAPEAASHSDMMSRRRSHSAVVHPELQEFRSFLLCLGPRPRPEWTLDRKDPQDPEYAPGKVRWADKRQQANNRRTTILLDVGGEIRPLTDWARLTDQEPKTLRKRLDRGYRHEEVVYGRKVQAPQQAVEQPLEATAAGYGIWPASKRDLWEDGFQSFIAYAKHDPVLRKHPERALTREVFLAWIGGNILKVAKDGTDEMKGKDGLRALYPGYDDPECDIEPSAVRADPLYRLVETYSEPVRRAWSFTLNDPAQDNLLRNYLRRYRMRSLPQDWAARFKRPEGD